MKPTTLQTIVVMMLCAGIAVAWLLRPVSVDVAQENIPLHVEAGCDSAQRSCRLLGDDIEFELSLGPPVRTMQTFVVVLHRLRGDIAADAHVEVQFQMRDMDMGLNRYRLIADADGVWRGQAMLPVCSDDRSDWLAQVTITANGKAWQAQLPFVVGGS